MPLPLRQFSDYDVPSYRGLCGTGDPRLAGHWRGGWLMVRMPSPQRQHRLLYLWLVSLKERQRSIRKFHFLALSDFAYLVGHPIRHVPTPTAHVHCP